MQWTKSANKKEERKKKERRNITITIGFCKNAKT
jgi:hypothetical protein